MFPSQPQSHCHVYFDYNCSQDRGGLEQGSKVSFEMFIKLPHLLIDLQLQVRSRGTACTNRFPVLSVSYACTHTPHPGTIIALYVTPILHYTHTSQSSLMLRRLWQPRPRSPDSSHKPNDLSSRSSQLPLDLHTSRTSTTLLTRGLG